MTAAPIPGHGRVWLAAVALLPLVVVVATALALFRYDVLGSYSRHSSTVSGVGVGSGRPATQTRQLAPFHDVELAGANNVTVVVGGRQRVVVRGDDNLLDHVTTIVRRGSLVIGNTGSLTTTSPMSVHLTLPAVSTITLSGSGVITVDNVRGGALTVRLPGAGVVRMRGAVDRLAISLSGTGDAELGGVVAQHVQAVVAGTGRIVVRPASSLDAAVGGTGSIVYLGDPPQVTTHITGTGAVTRG